MDFRNVIFAIALSFAVLFGWSVIFETPEIEKQKTSQQTENKDQDSSTPSVNIESAEDPNISRGDAIKSTDRIKFENENVEGSIALKGALIDDITFKKYNQTLGTNKKVKNIEHHCLFFDKDFNQHAKEIYENPQWPEEPLFYASFASKTDDSVCPKKCENIVLLVPIAPDLKDSDSIREKYYNLIMNRLELLTNQKIRKHVIFKKSYSIN